MLRKISIIIAGAAVLLGSIAYTKARDDKADSQAKTPIAAASQDDTTKATDKDASQQPKQYWLGVRCVAPVPEMVRAQVDLPAESGVFVADVVPKGPAAAAGMQRHDIILAVGDKSVKEVADLIAAVDQSQGKKLSLRILRGGEQQDIELVPQQRPAEFAAKGLIDMPPDSKWYKLGQLFDQSRPGLDGRPPLSMRFMHPGMILPPLPSGMTVTVTRKGDEPAEITVERDGKQWKVSADDLDTLPEDIRPHVARMIGGDNLAPTTPPGMLPSGTLGDKMRIPDPAEIEKIIQQRMQKQVDTMNRQMQKLEKMAEDLRKERALLAEPKKLAPQADEKTQPEKKTDK